MYDWDICILCSARDRAEAEELARSIRAYRLPRGVSPAEGLDHHRVTVMAGEGSPEGQADPAGSRWLLVLCSPASRTDSAVRSALDRYRAMRGSDTIIPVLLSGEPQDVMPEGFIEQKAVRHILPDMTVVERMETIEPVAADLRADTAARRKKLLRYETTRIVASVLDMHPDELEQRHQARERRAVLTAVALAAAVCLTAAGIFLRLGLAAAREGDIAAQQAEQAARIAGRTIGELPERFAGDPQALEYIEEAAAAARASLEELGLGGLMDGSEEGGE